MHTTIIVNLSTSKNYVQGLNSFFNQPHTREDILSINCLHHGSWPQILADMHFIPSAIPLESGTSCQVVTKHNPFPRIATAKGSLQTLATKWAIMAHLLSNMSNMVSYGHWTPKWQSENWLYKSLFLIWLMTIPQYGYPTIGNWIHSQSRSYDVHLTHPDVKWI